MQTLLICGGTKEERLALSIQKVKGLNKEDLVILEGITSLGIGEVRELEHRLALKPYSSPYKACIIHDAQILTLAAQNALLKTLEEPPQKTLLILTAPFAETLLPTIISRCQIIQLPSKTEIQLSDNELLEQLLHLEVELSPQIEERLEFAAKIARDRQEACDFLSRQMIIWRQILLNKLQITTFSKGRGKPSIDKLRALTVTQLLNILRQLAKTKYLIEANVNSRLALEVFLLDLPGLEFTRH